MNWVFREATIAPATRGESARVQEYAELVDSTGAVVYSVNKPYGEDVTAEVNSALCVTDDTVAVKKATVTLTDAEIKALPTTSVELVPAPGAGKLLIFDSALIVPNFPVAYDAGPIDNGMAFMVQYAENTNKVSVLSYDVDTIDAFQSGLPSGNQIFHLTPQTRVGVTFQDGEIVGTSYDRGDVNQPLVLSLVNGQNLTGTGTGDNEITVEIAYKVMTVPYV
jgi:hypothetical protein